MTGDERMADDEQFTRMLVAWEQALTTGTDPAEPDSSITPPDLRQRLERGRTCLQLLHRVLPRRKGAASASTGAGPDATFSRLGRFEIRGELGRGTSGIVFLAYDPQLCREVALKVPRVEALVNPEGRERFLREARAAAALDHPNVVAIYDVGEAGPVCYIASAYCPGMTLAAWLKRRADPVPVREAAALMAILANAVQHAHERGIVHRDLKPANILLQNDEHGTMNDERKKSATAPFIIYHSSFINPKITDFGLAKYLDAGAAQTQSGAIVGTPQYMAPEQARGKNREVGPAADVYALGAILYELLTGRPPFRGDTTLETLEQVCSAEPVPPRRLRPKLPRDLQTVCLKCLEKEPRRRYAGAAALAEDLRRVLDGRPVQARPSGAVGRTLKWARRQPVVAALTAILLVAVVALVAGGLRYHVGMRAALHQTDSQKRRAQENLRKALAAVDQLLTRVGDKKLAPVPQAEAVRKDLLQDALRFYEDLLAEQADEPDLRQETARAYRRLGRILEDLMQSARAEQAYGESVARLRDLVAEFPATAAYRFDLGVSLTHQAAVWDLLDRTTEADQGYREAADIFTQLADAAREPEYRKQLARTHVKQARVQNKLRHREEAEAFLRRALALHRELAAEVPGDLANRQDLASACSQLSLHLLAVDRKQDAVPWAEEAVQIAEGLLAESPEDPNLRFYLAGFSMNLANAFSDLGQARQTQEAYRRCERHLRKLVADFPSTPQYRFYLAGVCGNLGHALKKEGRFAEAEQAYRERLALHQKLAAAFPQVAGYRSQVAVGHYDLAKLCRLTKQLTEARTWGEDALRHGRRAVEMAPTIVLYQILLRDYHQFHAETLLELAEHAAAALSAAELPRLHPGVPLEYVTAAGLFAHAAAVAEKDRRLADSARGDAAKAYAGQALAFLAEAIRTGYRDGEHLRTAADLAPLRALPGFGERLAELERKD
jgi:tetratricopeptide (TPR) repeat protein